MNAYHTLAAAIVALGIGLTTGPARAQTTHTVNVWGSHLEVPDQGAGGLFGGLFGGLDQTTASRAEVSETRTYTSLRGIKTPVEGRKRNAR